MCVLPGVCQGSAVIANSLAMRTKKHGDPDAAIASFAGNEDAG